MNSGSIRYKPVRGQTFSLFDTDTNTEEYYRTIKSLTDKCLKDFEGEKDLLHFVQMLGRKKRQLNSLYLRKNNTRPESDILKLLYPVLHPYTFEVNEHLSKLPLLKSFDRTLNTNEYQYHLQMLEVELVNRINKARFKKAKFRFALLPHCLRDFTKQCKAEMGDLDYVCKQCNKDCFVKHASVTLKKFNIAPYIWMNMNLKKLARKLKTNDEDFGVLGIACFPELVNGMRMCMKADIPVVGIPLNANRCARWTGRFLENSVNIEALERLLSGDELINDNIDFKSQI